MAKGQQKKKKETELLNLCESEVVFSGTPVNEIMNSTYKPFTHNKYTGNMELKIGDVTMTSTNPNMKQITENFIGLFLIVIRELVKTNENTVYIDIKKLAENSGFTGVKDANPKIAKQELDNFRKIYNKAFNELNSIEIKFTPKYKAWNDEVDFRSKHIVTGHGLSKGVYYIEINEYIARTLRANGFVTQLHESVFTLGGQKGKGFKRQLSFFLSLYYELKNNRQRGTNNILSIESVLKHTTLSDVDELRQTGNRGYRRLILEPLEETLDSMKENGNLLGYEYRRAKKEPITDEEMLEMSAYNLIKTGYIRFEMKTEKYPTLKAWNEAPEHKNDQL